MSTCATYVFEYYFTFTHIPDGCYIESVLICSAEKQLKSRPS